MKLFSNKTKNCDVKRGKYFTAVMLSALLNMILMLRWEEEALCQSFCNFHDQSSLPVDVSTSGLWSLMTIQEGDTIFLFSGVSNREWERARGHGQASCQDCGWDHHQLHPSIQLSFFRISQAAALRPVSCQILKIGKNKSGSSPQKKKNREFLPYTIILNTFLLCSVIKGKSRLGSEDFSKKTLPN